MSREEEADEEGFEQLERFLEDWPRRDFLRRMGGAAAWTAFLGGVLEFLDACGGGTTATSQNGKKGGHIVQGAFSDVRTFNSMRSSETPSNQLNGLSFDGVLKSKKN